MGTDIANDKPEQQAMTPVVRRPGSMIESFTTAGPVVETSIDVKTPQGKTDYMRCLGTADRLAMQVAGQEIYIRDWLIHEVELTDEATGELYPAARLVLVEHDGKTVSTCSESLIGGISHLLRLYGRGPWVPTLAITINAIKAKIKGHYLQIGASAQRNPEGTTPKTKRV
jgi:hypothetical protein